MKTLSLIGTLVLSLGFLAACQSKENPALKNLSAQEFASQIQSKGDSVLVVDVRTPEEYQSGHIAGAISVDYRGSAFASEVAKLPKDKPVYIYCRSGGRSQASAPVFLDAGFALVHNLAGGIMGWENAKLPISKE
jgi:rhodanese-related sulfurtransferase